MLVTVDHLRNGHASVLKKHIQSDVLLFSMLLSVVQSYMAVMRKKTFKAY